MTKIRIKSDTHEHQGELVKPGTVIETDEATAKHLQELGAAEIIKGSTDTNP